jgi:hypothetical protein
VREEVTVKTLTPIDVWPARKSSGRPGYSRRHFETMAGAQEDPLRVADRIAAQGISARVKAEGVTEPDEVSRRTSQIAEENWAALCASFDAVISTLELSPQTAVIR